MWQSGVPRLLVVLGFRPYARNEARVQILNRARSVASILEPGATLYEQGLGNSVIMTSAARPRVPGTTNLSTSTQSDGPSCPPDGQLVVDGERVSVRTDGVGLKAIYVAKRQGVVGFSTSALALGATLAAQLDERAWGHLALLGFILGTESPFDGVARLSGGDEATLLDGQLSWAKARGNIDCVGGEAGLGASAFKHAVEDMLSAEPDAALELSGGLDSRLILAAIPTIQRRGRDAFTVDSDSGEDLTIARQIAKDHGLNHVVVSTSAAHLSTPQIVLRVQRAALRGDSQANCLAGASLNLAEEQLPPHPRFSGVNGEFIRGFYYPGIPPCATTNARWVNRLIDWRLLANEQSNSAIFSPGWLDEQIAGLRRDLLVRFRSEHSKLRPATDSFYMNDRVVRWAGPNYSAASADRAVLAPFLHPTFLAWARSVPPSVRSGSRVAAALLAELDPGLAHHRLADTHLSPYMINSSRPGDLLSKGSHTVELASKKLLQRFRGERKPPSGATSLSAALNEEWPQWLDLSLLQRVPFMAPDTVAEFVHAEFGLDEITTSFLMNLLAALQVLKEANRAAPLGPNDYV